MQYVPQTGSLRKPIATWVIVLAFALVICFLIIAAPLALGGGHQSIAYNIYLPFSYLCHQLPSRSFYFAEHPFAVCSRCTGIYAGFLLGVILYPLVKSFRSTVTPPRKFLFLAAVPLAIDFSLYFFGVWNNTHFSRFFTGALLGTVVVFYVLPGLMELSLRQRTISAVQSPPKLTTGKLLTHTSSAPTDYSAPERRI
ncbi:MAG TPA: DUF2085 domain-containing protein [Pyrinomonadaceae bacterium]